MARGTGLRPWKRGTEAARSTATAVVPNGDLIVTDEGNVYAGDGTAQTKDLARLAKVTEAVRTATSPLDQTIGAMPVQKVMGNKWFNGRFVQGNNTGLAADPRQPAQFNNVIDGSTLTGATYGTNKTGLVVNTVFKGGFSAEAGYGVVDPNALFGEVVFTVSGKTAGDLASATAFYAGTVEAHIYTPNSSLGTLIGLEVVANLESDATNATVTNAYSLHARAPENRAAGAVMDNAYAAYFEAPTGATRNWSARFKGLAQFDGKALFGGATLNSSATGLGDPGVYIGRDSGSGSVVELYNATTNIQLANSLANQLEIRLAGTRVMAAFTAAGAMTMDGMGSFGRGTNTSTPGTQAAAKGVHVGRAASGTVGVELAGGSDNFRIANDANGGLAFEKTGVAQLGRFNGSGDFFITKGLSFAPATQTTAPAAGAAAALPATPTGYADITIGGTLRKVAYY
ncbi:hypothetical protein U2G91_17220 [Rhodococcoides fascians]|uniref:hypothetical protein n=1 Tax=Rhodococcoides fascians TaxID=1828 RepID=UPI002ACE0405|nr:hypothetical protein [Rhodococcus fascians]WQH26822.1 hypothetical protein U2G91_17220 [Rhodococcus fascians]